MFQNATHATVNKDETVNFHISKLFLLKKKPVTHN